MVHRARASMLVLAAVLLGVMRFQIPGEAAAQPGAERERISLTTVPARPPGAMTGSRFAEVTRGLLGSVRQRRAQAELLAGNIPQFLRQLEPVELLASRGDGSAVRVTAWVMPDYLAIGSDEDFLRIPLDYYRATTVANRFGCVLPTPKIVDAVYEQADLHFSPQPMTPGPKMRSSGYYLRHQQMIESQREGKAPGTLAAGHKKDVVITNRLRMRGRRVAIYGWHRANGDSIQPLSTIHDAHYADYSHGVRLVWRTVSVEGELRDIKDVFSDPVLAPALTYEGSFPEIYSLMHPRAEGTSEAISGTAASPEG